MNKGKDVIFPSIDIDPGRFLVNFNVFEPNLDFSQPVDVFAGAVLGLNFKDDDESTIDMIAVKSLKNADGKAGGQMALPDLEGWNNTVVLREGAVDSDDAGFPFVAGHEVGHCLFDGGAEIHSSLITNLFRFAVSDTDHISTTKRLDDEIKGVSQHDYARTQSDWNTIPPLLQKE